MSRFGRSVAALGSGIALALAFPEPDLFPLAWVALAPLLVVARPAGPGGGFALGVLFGVGFFGTLLYWISIVGWVAWVVLVLLEALFVGLFGALWAGLAPRVPAWGRVVGAPALWVVVEYLRTIVPLGGFPWGQLAQSQRGALWVLALAGIGGSWLVAYLLVTLNALAAEVWTAIDNRSWARVGGATGIALLLLGATVLVPSPSVPGNGERPRVAIVQGNVPREFVGDLYEKELSIIKSHERLTKALEPGSVDLVVWPESAVGIDLERNEEAARAVTSAARAVGAPMIVGGNLDVGTERYKVMAFHVSAEGEIVDRYQKTHLVPFGEYVPARAALDWLPILDQVPRDAIPAAEETIFDIDGIPVAPLISFEGDFGSLARRRIDAGGRLLVVATNTSTWEESWASAQHVGFSQVRAAENGVWVVHAALSGISAFIAPDGRVVESAPLWEATTIARPVGIAASPTFYARTGDWLPIVCLGIVVALAGSSTIRRRRGVPTE